MRMNQKLFSRLRGNDDVFLTVIPAKAGTQLRYKLHRHPGLEPGQGFLNLVSRLRGNDDVFLTVIPEKAGTQL